MPSPSFPTYRPRRLRRTEALRTLVRETVLTPADLIWPIFLQDGQDVTQPIPTMPGVNRLSVDRAVGAAQQAAALGIPAICLFPNTAAEKRTSTCAEAWNPDNQSNRATRAIKDAVPDILVMTDVALDPYNAAGHDGLVVGDEVVNDPTLEALAKQAVSQARAGADIIGPSDMMDGRIGAIRTALDANGFQQVAVMSYAAKFASACYGPFRDAVGASGTLSGDKKTYQLDPANGAEALRMVARDLAEGADMVMVKPGQPYLDICRQTKDQFGCPTFAYQVSGEYAMIQAAAAAGCADLDAVMMESLIGFKRAGCDGVLTYFAPQAARLLAG